MMKKPIGILVSCFALLAACDMRIDGAGFTRSYVQVYTVSDAVAGNFWASPQPRVTMGFTGEEIDFMAEKHKARYDALCEYFGDMHYKRRTVPFIHLALADEFVSADAVSDRDFDAQHPAGASLGDVLVFKNTSCCDFIRNGYKGLQDTPISKPLGELTAGDMVLMTPGFVLEFLVVPPQGGSNLTVSFRTADKEVSGVVAIEMP